MPERRGLLRFLAYAGVGAVGTAVQYAFLVAAVRTHGLAPVPATMVGATLGAVVNYVLNARLTFRGRGRASAIPKFAATALLGVLLNGLAMKLLMALTPLDYLACQVLATLAVLGVTYLINLSWTFRRVDKPT